MTFGERLRVLREKEGLHQKEMATKLKMANTTYHNYESGKREPDIETIKYISNFFDVTTDYLLGKTDNPKTVVKFDIPEELKEIGVQYLVVARQMQDHKITPEEAKRIIAAIEAYKNTSPLD